MLYLIVELIVVPWLLVVMNLIAFYRYYFDLVLDFVFKIYYRSKKQRLPTIKNRIVLESATSLARKIKTRELTSVEIVTAFIDRCKEVDGILNAIVDDRYAAALKEAREVDLKIARGDITQDDYVMKPFLGVPFTAKENIACNGMKWTFGILARQNERADTDARTIQLMKGAGAILIAVTNVPQLSFWMETYNPIHGVTKNPYDTTRSVGGSAGGEGSLVAACGSPIGIGNDCDGSIRVPAHRCGVFAHKCTAKLTSANGTNFSKENSETIDVVGPIVKYAEDILPVLEVLVGDNVTELKLRDKVDCSKDLQIYFCLKSRCRFASPMREEMKDLMKRVADVLKEVCAKEPMELRIEHSKSAMSFWGYKIRQEGLDFSSMAVNNDGRANGPKELIKYIWGKREFNFYTILNMLNVMTIGFNSIRTPKLLDGAKQNLSEVLSTDGVLLFPSEPFTASYPYASIFRPYNISYAVFWNALGFPVTQVPLGLNEEGIPIGIQVVAAPYQDHLCVAAAKLLEKVFKGYVPPSICSDL